MAEKKTVITEEAPKKKGLKTKDIIILMIVVAAIASLILVAVNVIKGSSSNSSDGVSAERIYKQISDSVKAMIRGADLEVKYVNSDKRTVLYFIGSSSYCAIRYFPDQQRLYTFEGTYTANATTDALKISEAESKITNGNFLDYANEITSFVVNNANGKGLFDDGEVKITLAVSNNGGVKRDTFAEKFPVKEAAAE